MNKTTILVKLIITLTLTPLMYAMEDPFSKIATLKDALPYSIFIRYKDINSPHTGIDYELIINNKRYKISCLELDGKGLTFYDHMLAKAKEEVDSDGYKYHVEEHDKYKIVYKVKDNYAMTGENKYILFANIIDSKYYYSIEVNDKTADSIIKLSADVFNANLVEYSVKFSLGKLSDFKK
jgi:hypothetical protein